MSEGDIIAMVGDLYIEEESLFVCGETVLATVTSNDKVSVDITSGLEEGQSYFYRYAGTITYSFEEARSL